MVFSLGTLPGRLVAPKNLRWLLLPLMIAALFFTSYLPLATIAENALFTWLYSPSPSREANVTVWHWQKETRSLHPAQTASEIAAEFRRHPPAHLVLLFDQTKNPVTDRLYLLVENLKKSEQAPAKSPDTLEPENQEAEFRVTDLQKSIPQSPLLDHEVSPDQLSAIADNALFLASPNQLLLDRLFEESSPTFPVTLLAPPAISGKRQAHPALSVAATPQANESSGVLNRLRGFWRQWFPSQWQQKAYGISTTLPLSSRKTAILGIPTLELTTPQTDSIYRPLIWKEGHQYQPDSLLVLWQQLTQQSFQYHPSGWLKSSKQSLPLTLETHFLAYPVSYGIKQLKSQVTPLSLAALTRQLSSSENTVVVLTESPRHPALPVLLSALPALAQEKPPTTPWWDLPLRMILLLGLTLLFWLAWNRVGLPVILGITLALLTACLSCLALGLLLANIWLSLVPVSIFMVIASGLLLACRLIRHRQESIRQKLSILQRQLAAAQIDLGNLDEARQLLFADTDNDHALDLLYRIGREWEKQRQYDEALSVYQHLQERHPHFRDIDKRIASLTQARSPAATLVTPAAQSTLVVETQAIERPVLGRYQIDRELGRGAMGTVYLGHDPKIGRSVAIKTLDYSQFSGEELEAVKERFAREAETSGRLDHPGIVTIYDAGEAAGLSYIAMDYVPGASLEKFCTEENSLPVATVYEIIAQAADALAYAHQQQVIHRDIKPANIIYNPDTGQIKIMDFGIARVMDHSRTRTGTILGSPFYMSPEQIRGEKVDGRADIWSLTVTFYQLLTLQLPFQGDSLANLAYQITQKKHVPIKSIRPDLPASATRITNKGLQKQAEKRYNSAEEMAQAIRKANDIH